MCIVWWPFFNRQSGFLCFPTIFLFSSTCFPHAYEVDFIQGIRKENGKKLARLFDFTFVFSLNQFKFGDCVDRIYPTDLEIKDTTDTAKSASYLDMHIEIHVKVVLRTSLYDIIDDINIPIGSLWLN
jgi:hypothetical protein